MGSSSVIGGAHPRLRGEHVDEAAAIQGKVGSSPLTRGARDNRPVDADGDRLIPAYAGSTGKVSFYAWLLSAHPRLRGEHR